MTDEIKKVGAAYRVAAAFVAVMSLVALLGFVLFGLESSVDVVLLLAASGAVLALYVTVPILVTGYPPPLFRWTVRQRKAGVGTR